MVLVLLPVTVESGGLNQEGQNYGQPASSDIPKIGAVHQVFDSPVHIRPFGQEFQGMVKVAGW